MHIPLPTSCSFSLPFTIRNPIKCKKTEQSFTFLGLQSRPVPEQLVTPPCTRDILASRTAAPTARPAARPAALPAQSHASTIRRGTRPREEGSAEPRKLRHGGNTGVMRGQASGLGLSRRGGVRRRRTQARSVRSTTAVGSRIAGSRSRSKSKSKFTEHLDASRDGDEAGAEEVRPYLRHSNGSGHV